MYTKSFKFKLIYLFLTILIKCRILNIRSEGDDMKRLLIKMGIHGVRHQIAEKRLLDWCHIMGIGA